MPLLDANTRAAADRADPCPDVEEIEKNTVKKALADALENRGYTTLTPVQEAVTNPELEGADLLVSAQTGSGKTLGFGLAIAPTLLGDAEVFGTAAQPLALIIAPTRELALQVKRELGWLYAKAGAVVASCVGGMDMRDERRNLQRGAHIVVATPGRLRDHITRNSIDLSHIRAIVLDEADEMLDLGFREDLEFILSEAPKERQTLLFSATVPKSIAYLAKSYQKDAVRIATTSESSQHADIEYCAMSVADRDTENAIINVLRFYEAPNALVFGNTRAMVNRLTTRLSNRGFSVVALSGELSQTERTHALQAMRDGRARVCVATDVAARGIDLPNLDLVIHAELPSNHETLLHRSGRTGRAGRKGVSVLIVPPKARRKAERILKSAKLVADWGPAPSADVVKSRDHERLMADPAWNEAIAESDRGAVQTLTERFSAPQIAAAFLRLYNLRHSPPEDLIDMDTTPAQRPAFGASVWFSINGGRDQNAEPRRLLPKICDAGGLTKMDIGAIRVQPKETYVEILESRVPAFLDAIGPKMQIEPGMIMTQLDSPPKIERMDPVPRGTKTWERKERPARAPRSGDTPPTDWNDEAPARKRKPKPADRPASAKKREDGDKPRDFAPRFKRPESDEPRGPKPPAGKKNSKKNKARAAAKAEEAAASGKPKRRSK